MMKEKMQSEAAPEEQIPIWLVYAITVGSIALFITTYFLYVLGV